MGAQLFETACAINRVATEAARQDPGVLSALQQIRKYANAAPDLYEALEKLWRAVGLSGCSEPVLQFIPERLVRDALAAARGKEGEAPRPTLKRTPPALPVVHPAPVKI
jgi:hypothetical protein